MIGGVNHDREDRAASAGLSLNGRTLGSYRLLHPIGRGHSGEVYLAEHAEDGTPVAVKVLLLHLADTERQAFLDEMQIVGALRHPHLIQVFDYDLAGDVPYIVMSYAPHGTLSHILPDGEALAPERILPYVEQVADALHYAHEHHVQHLNLQPGNLLLGSNYEVLLSDIALARLVQEARSSRSLDVTGNILYLAPEQLRGKGDAASDQYALGVITYQWLCGRCPFEGTFIEVSKRHLHSPVPSLCVSVPTLPVGIEQVVLRALAKDPARRFEDIKAFAHAFEEACRPQTFPPFSLSNVLTQMSSTNQLTVSVPTGTSDSSLENALSPEAGRDGSEPFLFAEAGEESDAFVPVDAGISSPDASMATAIAPEAEEPVQTEKVVGDSPSLKGKREIGGEMLAERVERVEHVEQPIDIEQQTKESIAQPAEDSEAANVLQMPPRPRMPVAPARPKQSVPAQVLPPASVQPSSFADEAYIPSFPTQSDSPTWQMMDEAPVPVWPQQPAPVLPADPFAPFPAVHDPLAPAQIEPAWTPVPEPFAVSPASWKTNTFVQRSLKLLAVRPGVRRPLRRPAARPIVRPATAYVNTKLPPRPDMYVQRFSRRTVMAGVVGLVGLAAIGGGTAWYLMQPRNVTLGTTLYTYVRHGNQVLAATWSPAVANAASTVPRIASGSLDHTVQVWDALTGDNAYTYNGHTSGVEVVEWSPNGENIASGGVDRQVHIWNAATGHRLLAYRGHSDSVLSLSWSPTGKYIASAGKDATVQVWDAQNGHLLLTYRGHGDWVGSVAWSPNGKYIASASADRTVQVWDAQQGHRILTYKGHTGKVWAVAWASDSQRLASGGDDSTVRVWQATTGYSIYTYRGHSNPVEAVAWSPDGQRIASGGEDKTVQVWHPSSDENAFTYSNHYGTVWSVAWSPDGQHIASGSLDHTVQVWQAV